MSVGPFQILVIALIVLLLFGRGRVGRSLGELGEGVTRFRSALRDHDAPVALRADTESAEQG